MQKPLVRGQASKLVMRGFFVPLSGASNHKPVAGIASRPQNEAIESKEVEFADPQGATSDPFRLVANLANHAAAPRREAELLPCIAPRLRVRDNLSVGWLKRREHQEQKSPGAH